MHDRVRLGDFLTGHGHGALAAAGIAPGARASYLEAAARATNVRRQRHLYDRPARLE